MAVRSGRGVVVGVLIARALPILYLVVAQLVSSPWASLALLVIALPLLAFAWFISYATLGGALGNPLSPTDGATDASRSSRRRSSPHLTSPVKTNP